MANRVGKDEMRLLHVRLPIGPEWDAIEPLRASVLACVGAVFPDAALAERIALVAAELMENAVKYGAWSDREDECFSLLVTGSDERVSIEVTNPVAPGGGGLERLVCELERISSSPSPEEAFLKGLRAVALRRRDGLGLARIAYEGGCDVTAEIVGGGRILVVRAATRCQEPREATPAAPP